MIFKYKAYNTLLQELGRLDYVIEISEIAIKGLLRELEDSDVPENYLRDKSIECGIMVSYDPSNSLYNQIVLGNISNVYHLTETFFYELQTEYNEFENNKWFFCEGKTKLDQILEFLKDKGRVNMTDKVDDYLIDTFKYYHQLRVYFSHKKTTSLSEINKKHQTAISHYNVDLMNKYRITGPPKMISDINFEDYFLFTQIAKDISLKISSICYPEPKGLASTDKFKVLKRFMDKRDRLEQSVENLLKTEYGYVSENDSDNLVHLIVDGL